jgi:hypothetical protein
METIIILVAVTLLLLALAVAQVVRHTSQQRTEAIRHAAERLGWGYREEVPLTAVPDLQRFELFRRGSSRKLRHLMTSPPAETRAVVFEYAYTVSSGKSTRTYRQTVFHAAMDTVNLPSFSLRPERFHHRLGSMLGYQDIDLPGHPEFSRMFLLRGEDEGAVRATFHDGVAAFLARRAGMCATGAGRELLYWRPGRRLPPEELPVFIAEGLELAGLVAAGPRVM